MTDSMCSYNQQKNQHFIETYPNKTHHVNNNKIRALFTKQIAYDSIFDFQILTIRNGKIKLKNLGSKSFLSPFN